MVSEFASLEDALGAERPLFYIQPKDDLQFPEEDRQRAFLNSLRRLAPTISAYANVNAAKRSLWAAQKAQREGMRAGVFDLTLTWPGSGIAWAEFKNGQVTFPLSSKKTDRAQAAFGNMLFRQGHHVGVFRDGADLLRKLAEWGAPVIVKREDL